MCNAFAGINDQIFSVIHRQIGSKNLWTTIAMFSGIRDLFQHLGFSHSRMVEDIIDLNQMFPPSMVYEIEGLGTCHDPNGMKLSVHQLLIRKRKTEEPVCLWYKQEFDCGRWRGDHKASDVDMGEQSTGVHIFKEAQTSLPALIPGVRQSIVDIEQNKKRYEALLESLPVPEVGHSDLPPNMVVTLFSMHVIACHCMSLHTCEE